MTGRGRRSLLRELSKSGFPGIGMGNYDARTDHGYGRLGDPGPRGQHAVGPSMYPYAEDSLMLADLYPELAAGNEPDEDDSALAAKFAAKTGTARADIDHQAVKQNVRDRGSFVGPRLNLAWHIRVGMTLTEAFFNPDARDDAMSPRVSGTKHGWASPPIGGNWNDDENVWTLEDLADKEDEQAGL